MKLPWFKCYPDKLLSALGDLKSPDQKLLYVIIILRVYDNDGPIRQDFDLLSSRTGLSDERIKKALLKLVETGKIITSDGLISNPVAEKNLEARRKSSDALSEAATSRWGKHKQNQHSESNKASPIAVEEEVRGKKEQQLPLNQTTTIGVSKKPTRRPRCSDDYSEDFAKAWASYPRHQGTKKPDAYRSWCKLQPDQQATVLRVMPQWARMMSRREQEHIFHFATYLNQRVFDTLETAIIIARDQSAVVDPKDYSPERWASVCAMYRITNDWKQAWGPPPGYAGCLLPAKFIEQMSKSPLDAHSAAV